MLHLCARGLRCRELPRTVPVQARRYSAQVVTEALQPPENLDNLDARAIVKELDNWVIEQRDAKVAFANALRNRWRRHRLPEKLRSETLPKNILLIGPTGVGKTELARRVATLSNSPFLKVEATKYTEVGFRGQDVSDIINDLTSVGVNLVTNRVKERLRPTVASQVEESALAHLEDVWKKEIEIFEQAKQRGTPPAPLPLLEIIENYEADRSKKDEDGEQMAAVDVGEEPTAPLTLKERLRGPLREGLLGDIKVFYQERSPVHPPRPKREFDPNQRRGRHKAEEPSMSFSQVGFVLVSDKGEGEDLISTEVPLSHMMSMEREYFVDKLISPPAIEAQAIREVEEFGIVFIDEIDKICNYSYRDSSASDEGVQRDLLSIIEGTKVATQYGDVDTSAILFVTAGAFMIAKPSDLLAELQGRLPIRVKLTDLGANEFYRILTEPQANLLLQQRSLIATEGIELRFTDEAVRELAEMAVHINRSIENIGARRLHTLLELVTHDVSLNIHKYKGELVVIDTEDVQAILDKFKEKIDLQRYIL